RFMSYKIFLFAILMIFMVSGISQNAHATITSITLEPECGPPGTDVILIVRFTEGSNVDVEFSPDIIAGGDIGDEGMSLYFKVPEGVYSIKITITEDGIPVKVLKFTYCSTVGGLTIPTNKLEIITPYIAMAGLIIAVSTVIVINKRKG
ncbi:hypothetical protein, partial [[Eubacterium] cellulosolvens]